MSEKREQMKQETPLALTPLLQMAIRILQSDREQLLAMIDAELADNPCLVQRREPEAADDATVATIGEDGAISHVDLGELALIDDTPPDPSEPGGQEAAKQWQSAQWLITSLEKRRAMVQRLLGHLVALTPDYFSAAGETAPRITVSDLASALGLHESTVKRLVADKSVRCAHGVLPLAKFIG